MIPPTNFKTAIAIVMLFPPLLLLLRCDLSLCFHNSKRLHFYQYILIYNITYGGTVSILEKTTLSKTYNKLSIWAAYCMFYLKSLYLHV